ncbi:hypothetical protein [Ruegeria sp. HKCCD7255]|uniref:hypothetical protein n=1 Tax=Ruegeria sp. HKCCD7255 TaxID=2683004 RepID=UPI0014878132|nr:hypothetical protein [Ruegeria sp. HKCCD7255]
MDQIVYYRRQTVVWLSKVNESPAKPLGPGRLDARPTRGFENVKQAAAQKFKAYSLVDEPRTAGDSQLNTKALLCGGEILGTAGVCVTSASPFKGGH